MLEKLKSVLSEHRFYHSTQVAALAKQLAGIYGADGALAELAGQFHDCAREYAIPRLQKIVSENHLKTEPIEVENPVLLHSPVGAWVAQHEYQIQNLEVLSAIRWHSIGHDKMTLLEKIVYVADACSVDRKFPEASTIREMALKDLDRALQFLDRPHG